MRHQSVIALLALVPCATIAQAPEAGPRVIDGRVEVRGVPLADVNVFLKETLDGAMTDSLGAFRIVTRHVGVATLLAQRIGFMPRTISIGAATASPIVVDLSPQRVILAPMTALASRFAAGEERGASLTALDVVSTPGTTADVGRAIQTLPGTQAIDEGTALFVRGGDYTETKILLNEAVLQTSFSYESPNGTFIGTVDPFLVEGIVFAAGGFGARYGNALSGIATLRTMGLPPRTTYTAAAGLAAVSASAAIALTQDVGIRVAANETDTRLLFKVNGSTQPYDPAPKGFDRSASAIWSYSPGGELKLFAITQRTTLGTGIEEASYAGSFQLGINANLVVLNWSDSIARLRPFGRLSRTASNRAEDYGAFRLMTSERYLGAAAGTDIVISELLTLRGGVEWEGLRSSLEGTIPETSHDKKPGAPAVEFGSAPEGDRVGIFGEADFVLGRRTRIVAGARRDMSSLIGASTIDPRVSAAITIAPGVVVSGAWGIYHQVPDPLFLDATLGDPTLPSMRATHAIVGLQLGGEGTLLRVEAYDKRYTNLAQTTRDYDVVGGGGGHARGIDIFAAGDGAPGMRWRVSASLLSATRMDPHTSTLAPAPFDIPGTITTVIQQVLPHGWHLGATHRIATGRPYTPVLSATYDATNAVWVPTYASPMSERMPDFRRVDLGLTHLRSIAGVQAALYSGVTNLFDRENLFAYRYAPDYTTQIPIRSLFNRAYYVGASFSR